MTRSVPASLRRLPWARWVGVLRRHRLMVALVVLGATLRLLASVAYRPAIIYIDSVAVYLQNLWSFDAVTPDPLGYDILLLRPVLTVANLATVGRPTAPHRARHGHHHLRVARPQGSVALAGRARGRPDSAGRLPGPDRTQHHARPVVPGTPGGRAGDADLAASSGPAVTWRPGCFSGPRSPYGWWVCRCFWSRRCMCSSVVPTWRRRAGLATLALCFALPVVSYGGVRAARHGPVLAVQRRRRLPLRSGRHIRRLYRDWTCPRTRRCSAPRSRSDTGADRTTTRTTRRRRSSRSATRPG